MRIKELLLALLLGLVVLPGTGQPVAVDAAHTTFTDVMGRFSFAIPDGWILPDSSAVEASAVDLCSTFPYGTSTLTAEDIAGDVTLDEYASTAAMRLAGSLEKARLVPDGIQPYILADGPARIFVFQGQQQGQAIHVLQVIALRESTAYTLSFVSRPDEQEGYFTQEQIVLDSFTFL